MSYEDLARFSNDLLNRAGIENNVRRLGDEIVMKIGETEFFFSRDGRYRGLGSGHHTTLADLVAAIDPSSSGVFEVDPASISDAFDEEEDLITD